MAKEVKVNIPIKKGESEINRGEIVARVVFPGAVWLTEEQARKVGATTGIKGTTTRIEGAATKVTWGEGQKLPVIHAMADGTGMVFPKIIDDDKNFFRLIDATRKGLPYKSLRNAQVIMPFSSQEWARMLHVSKRSIDRLKKERRKLSSTQSEKLIEVTLLYDYGVDVFGSAEKFTKWLDKNNIALGGVEPKSLLDTNLGIKAVKTELSRIEYGVLA